MAQERTVLSFDTADPEGQDYLLVTRPNGSTYKAYISAFVDFGSVVVDTIDDVVLPGKKGFTTVKEATLLTDTPSLHIIYNDGNATTKDNLYVMILQKLSTIIAPE